MTWINWLIVGIVANAISPLLQKKLLVNKPTNLGPMLIGGLNLLGSAIVIFLYLLVQGGLSFNLAGKEINVLLTAVFYILGNFLYLYGMMHVTGAESMIVGTSAVIWTVLSAALFLGEKTTTNNILGIILIISGVILLNYQAKKIHFNKGHLLILAANVFFGLAMTNSFYVIKTSDPISYGLLAYLMATTGILAYGIPKSNPKDIVNYLKNKKVLLDIFIYSILGSVGYLASFFAFKAGGSASQISPLGQLTVLLTVLLSIIFLKERTQLPQKLVATVVMVIGAILVNL